MISLYLTKLSVLAILQRIFVQHQSGLKLLCVVTTGFLITSGFASVFIVTMSCPSSGFFTEHCSGQVRSKVDIYDFQIDHTARPQDGPLSQAWILQQKQ
jgi:hypothetical protein